MQRCNLLENLPFKKMLYYSRMQTSVGQATRFVFFEVVIDTIFFPVWWYTAGFVHALRFAGRWFADVRMMMGVGVWVRNWFVPMFAQYDFWGRVVSFLVRSAMIVFRTIGLLILSCFIVLYLVAYLVLPVLLLCGLLLQARAYFFL